MRTAVRRQVEVLVVGAGPAGMAMALAAARSGRKVEVVDDALVPGGGSRGLRSGDSELFARVRDTFDRATKAGEVRVRSRTVAAGVFGRDVLVVSAEEDGSVELVDAKTLVIAAGAHDGVAPFGNNDLPGVMSARAAAMLAAAGVSLGKEFVALVPRGVDGTGAVSFADAFESATSAGAVGRPTPRFTRVTDVLRVKGASQLRAVVVKDGDGERSIPADVLLVDVPRAPAYELCEQAGAKLSLGRGGYAPLLDRGRIAPGVFAIGEVTGIELDPARFVVDAEEIAAQIE